MPRQTLEIFRLPMPAVLATIVAIGCRRSDPAMFPAAVNRAFRVADVRVAPESLNAYIATQRGFTSSGGEMRCAYQPLGRDGMRIFVWALCLELLPSADGRDLVRGSGMSLPAALRIETQGGQSRVVGIEVPRDGDEYGASIRRIFPASVWPRIFPPAESANARGRALADHLQAKAVERFGLPPEAARRPSRKPGATQVPRAGTANSAITPAASDSGARDVRYFMCGGDFSHLPTSGKVVVDLRLHSKNENRIPTGEDVGAVTALGGTVLHRFNVAVIRMEIDAAALPRIVSEKGIADYVLNVPDLRVHDVPVQIFFARPITEADRAALRRVGVSRIGQHPVRPILSATAPDRALPEIQRFPGVEFARAQALSCESDF